MKRDVPPEEKLLRLIKNKKTSTSAKESIGRKKSFIDIRKWLALRRPGLKIGKVKEYLVGNLSRVLIFLLMGILIYFLLDSLLITPYYRHKIGKIGLESTRTEEADRETVIPKEKAEVGEKPEMPTKPYSYYSKDIVGRDIFKPLVQKEAKAVEDEFKIIRESLNLIGIIAGEQLQAAIEDKKKQRTYFVYKGEYIDSVLIEDVLENKVILNYKGEKFELML